MIKSIFENIKKSNSILLLTHERPDGDAVGSIASFYYMLTSINKSVDIIINDIPHAFNNYIPNCNVVDKPKNTYDLGIVLDCSNIDRVNGGSELLNLCNTTICIDHHNSNTLYCDINYVDGEAPACVQIIYDLFLKWGINISSNIGKSVAIGILTDTNGFSNNNVNARTFEIACELMKLNINIPDLYYQFFNVRTKSQFELMKIAINNLEFFENGKIAFSYITHDDFVNSGAYIGDHEGLVNVGRNISGVEVSIFIREDDGYRVSFRSTGKVVVSKIAEYFNGGGHDMASGCLINGDFEDIKKQLIEITKRYL